MVEFEWMEGTPACFEAAKRVRQAVFVDEQGYSLEGEFDAQDAVSLHIVGCEAGKPVCTARLFETAAGEWHIGRVAVLPEKRGTGLGLAMMKCVLEKASEMGARTLVLSAQADKYAFYERAGFALTGEKTLDEGQPHVTMQLVLAPV